MESCRAVVENRYRTNNRARYAQKSLKTLEVSFPVKTGIQYYQLVISSLNALRMFQICQSIAQSVAGRRPVSRP